MRLASDVAGEVVRAEAWWWVHDVSAVGACVGDLGRETRLNGVLAV